MVGKQVVGHRRNDSAATVLAEYKTQIMVEADRMALRVGQILRDAKQAAPGLFDRWVETELPFGADTARRLMAVSEAYTTRPPELVAQLPKPWQALYALRALPSAVLATAVADGDLTPDTSERDAKAFARRWKTGSTEPRSGRGRHHAADFAAGALMNYQPSDLHPVVRRNLVRWLDGTPPDL